VGQIVSIPLPTRVGSAPGAVPVARDAPASLGEFIVGPENRLIEVVCRSVLSPAADKYNPIFIHGPSGVGKSHLVRGLLEAWKHEFRRRPVYITAIDFVRDLADAIETQATTEFRHRFRAAPLLVIENLGELAERAAAQEELQSTMDAQLEAGHRVIVTAAAGPAELPGLRPSLRSRLGAGLVVPLVPPELQARREILSRMAERREVALTADALELLAAEARGVVPDLLGAVNQLEMVGRLHRRPITADDVRQLLRQRGGGQEPRVGDIAQLTARYFALKLADLRSPSRRQAVVKARGVAMYLARQLTRESLGAIGEYFGGRDHTTVLHGCRKTESLLGDEPAIHAAVTHLQQQLKVSL